MTQPAGPQGRPALVRPWRRVRAAGRTILQTAVAVGLAWLVATEGFGYQLPFFAPVAAIVTLSATSGAPVRRAVDLAAGVALGILVGDLLILSIGTGVVQIVVVIVLAMLAATLLGGTVLVVNQAAISAVLVATLLPPTTSLVPHRVFHAVIGGAVAVLVGHVLLRTPPVPGVDRVAQPVFDGLAQALVDTADALRIGDADAAEAALLRARALDPRVADWPRRSPTPRIWPSSRWAAGPSANVCRPTRRPCANSTWPCATPACWPGPASPCCLRRRPRMSTAAPWRR